ncbi:MAG: TrbC/VirB2 family protein [Elusimicrobiota bacterium]
MRRTRTKSAATVGLMLLAAARAHAQYGGNEGQLGSFLAQSANWLVTILGPGVIAIGVIMVGLSLAIGNVDAMRRGGYVIGGGALIFLSQALVAVLQRLASGF